jgi:YVTN family beta-propeller protein
VRSFRLASTIVLAAAAWARTAAALTADVPTRDPSLVGQAYTFRAVASGTVGVVQYRWNFGDGMPGVFSPNAGEVQHTFAQPGHYPVLVTIKDEAGFTSVGLVHTVNFPIPNRAPTASTDILYDRAHDRVFIVNEDDDSVSVVDPTALTKVAEIPVYQRPTALAIAPDGKIWVVHRDDYAVAVIDADRLAVERGFRLPYASQPTGLAMSPSGDAAYVTLMALGKLLKLDPSKGNVVGTVDIGSWCRGVSVSQDGRDVYVTRFISADSHGEVVRVDGPAMKVVARFSLAPDTTTMDSDQGARGAPNYLFSAVISPDGRQAWVPAKSDNIFRGTLRDMQELNQDDTVRPMVGILDLAQGTELRDLRIDLDDRNLPTHVEFSPLGDYAFVSLTGSGLVEVRDAYSKAFVTAMQQAGTAPRGLVLGPDHRLFVHGSLSRNLVVFDVADILASGDQSTKKIGEVPIVTRGKLSAEAHRGKQVFYNSADGRMTVEGYMSCASCHFEGFEDGRVWDFTSRGEGLRNTSSLLGRRGAGQGRLHWSGNFDEVQDFEQEIRALFNGSGFIADSDLAVGTRSDPLGDPKAGLSADLDALAAYLETLDHVDPSPYRNPDGSLTADAVAGKDVFFRLGCDFCHVGKDFTDSRRGMLHDVGTIKASSGNRSGKPLLGIDTPTLLGVWETAPYLHDGSAPTIRDVLTTANPRDAHGFTSSLSAKELDELVAYVMQIDNELPLRRLPFEPGAPGDAGPSDAGTVGRPPASTPKGLGHCGCKLGERSGSIEGAIVVLASLLALGWRRRRLAEGARLIGSSILLVGATACSALATDNGSNRHPGTDVDSGADADVDPPIEPAPSWANLPPVKDGDAELAHLATREAQYAKLCATPRGDRFFQRMCGGVRPNVADFAGLLRLVGLDRARAFALTGNSTSLVAMSVSALNPRIVVFPRVNDMLERPKELVALGFVRGEQFVEIASRDSATGAPNFYLLRFEQRCNYEAGCTLADLLTERIEHGWTAYSIYDERDLENTSFDCGACHRPGAYGTRKILRMQELVSPWMHWFPQRFLRRTDSDRVLGGQFLDAHGADAQYGGVPVATIANAVSEGSGAELEALIRAEGFGDQPNSFDPRIESEIADGGTSSTWLAQFQASLRGDAITVPYPGIDVTDATKRTAATKSYRDVVSGTAAPGTLIDIRDVLSQDAVEKLGFVPQPNADGRAVLLQMCSRCHDGRGNPEVNRAKFDVRKLDQMSRAEKDVAISRLMEPPTSPGKMPPWRAARMTDAATQVAIIELSK